ncbi:MAG: chromosome segregation protein SMC [Bacteriovoracaceae bacterium]|nr:chromosome segregation protein SMC [Bacteriovoracaceae bacterium]
MKLIRLHLQGFKSFKDKTTIQFDEGITGIVGPNGCGKSNIVDALFWVMGEQSAKHLRGAKMKDLIFAGSSKYSPGGFAEVTLVLQNDTGKHIHIANQVTRPAEIALTRKLYRNGETEYRINGMPARLKDIHEVFMDTGAGAKSYSIIAQGEINRLVQAKPEERRVMIEEVAGITKFKMRKKESLKKIERTQANLNRLSDLQSEIYKNLKQLEKQAEKAEKARRLKDKIKRHQLIVDSHKEFDYLTDFVNAKRKLAQNDEEFEKASMRKEHLELALEDERIKKTDLIEKIDGLQAEFNEMAKELAASEERLKHLKRAREDKEKRVEERQSENEELQGDIEARSEKLEELKDKLRDLESANYEEMDFSSMEERVENLKLDLSEKEELIRDLTSQMEDAKDSFSEIDQKVFRNNSKIEEYSGNLEDIASEIEEIETSTANYTDDLVKQREEVSQLKESLSELEQKHASAKSELKSKSEELKEKDAKLRVLSREVIQVESKRQSLIDINKSGEGVKEGALKFLEGEGKSSFEILGNIIECEKEYAKALETLFESSFDALVAADKNNDVLNQWYQQNPETSLDYIIPQENGADCGAETAERLRVKGLEDVVAINDILKINEDKYSRAMSVFFNGYYVVKNLSGELALKVAEDIQFKGLISLDGSVFVEKGLNDVKISKRNPDEAAMGVVQRNNLINELTEQYEGKKAELDELEESVACLDKEIDDLKNEYEDLSTELSQTNTKFVSLKSSLESREESFGATSSRLEILTKRKAEISKAKLEILETEEGLLDEKNDLEEKIEAYQEQLEELREREQEIKASYEEQRGELLEVQANAKTFHTQVEGLQSQIEDVEKQLQRYKEKHLSNTEMLETLEYEIQEAENSLEGLQEENSDQAEVMSEKESFLNLVKDELTQLLTGMQGRESEVKELVSTLNKIEKSNVELNLKVEQTIVDEEILVKDCFDKYRVNLRKVLKNFLELHSDELEELASLDSMYVMEGEEGEIQIKDEAYEFEKKFPAVLRESKEKFKRYRSEFNRLGEINWQAIEDYDRQRLRYDFLRDQEGQLKKSLEDLETAIMHIDEKSKSRFKEAYDEVNVRFEKVFPIIFGGGEARLEIVGDIDSNECGIDIVAKPPGKKMQSINLMSGGEKAMTAVSLIFSIFLVKPAPFCLLDEVDAPLDDANVGRFNELLREMSEESQFILITHNKKTMELNDTLYGVTMQEPGVSKAVSVQLH